MEKFTTSRLSDIIAWNNAVITCIKDNPIMKGFDYEIKSVSISFKTSGEHFVKMDNDQWTDLNITFNSSNPLQVTGASAEENVVNRIINSEIFTAVNKAIEKIKDDLTLKVEGSKKNIEMYCKTYLSSL